jgi:hypothetical protein
VKGRYPLDALGRLRQRTVDERAREVADRVRSAERAVRARQAARRERMAEEAERAEIAETERARLAAGTVRAGDLVRQAEWVAGADARARTLAARESEAERDLAAERREESLARGRLAQADADSKAVEKHRARWVEERVRAADAAEEENAAEVWQARRGKP